jgi:general transcription factor 3C polypeptide 2
MGASLTGRGAVQIWCLLNIREHSEEVSYLPGKKEKKPKKDTCTNDKSIEIKRPRGRPRKNPTENNEAISPITNKRKRGRPKKNPTVIAVDSTNCGTKYIASGSVSNGNNENNEEILRITYKSKKRPKGRPKKNSKDGTVSDPNCENQFVPLTVQLPDSAEFISPDVVPGSSDEHHSQQFSNTKEKNAKKAAANTKGKNAKKAAPNTKGKNAKKAASAYDSETLVARSRLDINHRERSCSPDTSRPLLIQCENEANHQPHGSPVLEPQASTCPIPQNVALPRIVSCLAHNGKVAWDVKWRPLSNLDSSCKHRMGYLAVLLGNGSLEV